MIVMPAYNAARTLEDTFRAIPAGYYDEIDRGGRPQPGRHGRAGAAPSSLKAIRHPHNVGYGGNQKTCYMEALRDGADDRGHAAPRRPVRPRDHPGDDPRPSSEGRADMVLGSRMLVPGGGEAGRACRSWKRVANRFLTTAENLAHGAHVRRVPHRLPGLQPALPARRSPSCRNSERLRLRHRGDLPGRARSACRVAEVPVASRYFADASSVGFRPGRRLRARHAVDGAALPAAPLRGILSQRQVPAADAPPHHSMRRPTAMNRPAALLLTLALAAPALAQDVAEPKSGVKFAVKSGDMSLLGVGLRTKTMLKVKVYAVGLYVADSALAGPLAAHKGKANTPAVLQGPGVGRLRQADRDEVHPRGEHGPDPGGLPRDPGRGRSREAQPVPRLLRRHQGGRGVRPDLEARAALSRRRWPGPTSPRSPTRTSPPPSSGSGSARSRSRRTSRRASPHGRASCIK